MREPAKVPVVGVFYNEIDQFHSWLTSVESQRAEGVQPIPVVVVSKHTQYIDEFRARTASCITERRLRPEDVHICEKNVGHTVAFQIGATRFVEASDAWPWIASLDPDARFAPEALRYLLRAGEQARRVGMLSPIVVKPRDDGDFRRPVAEVESVCHAGHFPFQPRCLTASGSRPGLINFWRSHFKNWHVGQVRTFLEHCPQCAPFATCFCSSLWNSRMFCEIGLPDERQFRTLNCGEIGYRAQLNGWSGRFAPGAFAFHPNAPDGDYASDRAVAEKGCTAWHFYHAQGLIALRYFPDGLRNIAERRDDVFVPWECYFPDLKGIEPDKDHASRQAIFDRWNEFNFRQ